LALSGGGTTKPWLRETRYPDPAGHRQLSPRVPNPPPRASRGCLPYPPALVTWIQASILLVRTDSLTLACPSCGALAGGSAPSTPGAIGKNGGKRVSWDQSRVGLGQLAGAPVGASRGAKPRPLRGVHEPKAVALNSACVIQKSSVGRYQYLGPNSSYLASICNRHPVW